MATVVLSRSLTHRRWRVEACAARHHPAHPKRGAHRGDVSLALLNGFTDLRQALKDKEGLYDSAQEALDDHAEECDSLIK